MDTSEQYLLEEQVKYLERELGKMDDAVIELSNELALYKRFLPLDPLSGFAYHQLVVSIEQALYHDAKMAKPLFRQEPFG